MFWAATRTALWAQSSTAAFSAGNGGQITTSGPPGPGAVGKELAEEGLRLLDGLVHLPVRGQVWRRSGIGHLASAPRPPAAPCPRAAPARRRRRSRPSRRRRRGRTPAAPRRSRRPRPRWSPGAAATASAIARVPAANGSSSKAPIGPFQSTVPALGDRLPRNSAAVRGPMSRPIQPSGTSTPSDSRRSAAASKRSPSTRSTGSRSRQSDASACCSASRRQPNPFLLDQRVPGRDPLGAKEAEAHRAADQDLVGKLQETLDHADLVAHLGAAEDHDQRPGRVRDDGAQLADLALQQQSRVGGQQVRHTLRRRMGAVRGAESVVDVGIREPGQRSGQLRVVLGLPGLEAAVLEQQQPTVGEPGGELGGLLPDHFAGLGHLGSEQLRKPLPHRAHRERRVGPAAGPAEMRNEHGAGAALAQQLDRRQRGADPGVVLDPAVSRAAR